MLKSFHLLLAAFGLFALNACQQPEPQYSGNPLFSEPFTADPAVLVHNDTLYLFTGSDEQIEGRDGFVMHKWYVFSTADMVNWTNHGAVLSVEDFEWASHNAFAGHAVENHGKFWWYVPLVHKDPEARVHEDRKSTRLNSSHVRISYAVFCLKKKKNARNTRRRRAG